MDDDSRRKRFHKMRPLAQEAIDWKITKHIESQWQQNVQMAGVAVFDGGQEERDLSAYRQRMREKILAGSEATVMKIIEDYAQSPEYHDMHPDSKNEQSSALRHARRRDEPDSRERER